MRFFDSKTPRNRFGLGDLVGKIYNRIDDRTDFALGFRHSFVEVNDLISLGLRYKHSDTFTLKTKVWIIKGIILIWDRLIVL